MATSVTASITNKVTRASVHADRYSQYSLECYSLWSSLFFNSGVTMTTHFDSPADLQASMGQHLGYSDWLEIDQNRIDLFADATGDHQWIHVDPERAASGPFGKTIAHGYLSLSLVNMFLPQIMKVDNVSMFFFQVLGIIFPGIKG